MDVAEWLRPQSRGDAELVRRHRFHQSRYRAFVLGLPAATGPQRASTLQLGSMPTAEDGAEGRSFLTEKIHRTVEARIAADGTVEPFRCRHSMLSSQPMCFNLFGPLVDRPDLAAAFVNSVTGRTVEVEPGGVIIEESPGHLGDRTGLDASIRYVTSDGEAGMLGIETKLTEEFSPKVYPVDSKPAYLRYSTGNDSPFEPDRLRELTDGRWNQLWRNQMLCEAIKAEEHRSYAEQVVVYPGDMQATGELVDQYARLLSRRDAVRTSTLSESVTVLEKAVSADETTWLRDFRTRYLDLHLSSSLYSSWTAQGTPGG